MEIMSSKVIARLFAAERPQGLIRVIDRTTKKEKRKNLFMEFLLVDKWI